MDKRFHKSDSVLYQYSIIKYPLEKPHPTFLRQIVMVHATDGVKWQEIATEIHDLRKRSPVSGSPILMTMMVDYPEFVVALTLEGAVKIIKQLCEKNPLPSEYSWFEQVDTFAKEMVASRDHRTYVKSLNGSKEEKTVRDFWPL